MIPIAKPLIEEEEIENGITVLKSGIIAEGPKVKEFEEAFAKYIGVKHAVAVNSGTAALHVALLAKGIGEGDEVITTPFSFIATANSVLYTGAKPVFADVKAGTFNIDPEDIKNKITKKTKAIIPVDLYGHPAEMKAIMDIAKDHKLAVIEDAAAIPPSSRNVPTPTRECTEAAAKAAAAVSADPSASTMRSPIRSTT
jgi:dTDP-4-amino-4,6-dideoxygalactose transaminase